MSSTVNALEREAHEHAENQYRFERLARLATGEARKEAADYAEMCRARVLVTRQTIEDIGDANADLRRHYDDLVAALRIGDIRGVAAAAARMTPGMDRIAPATVRERQAAVA